MLESRSPGAAYRQPDQQASPADPIALARQKLKKALPRRFYKEARAEAREGAYVLLLDGRPARTPKGKRLAFPSLAAAEAIAAEWAAQAEWIDPALMPMTRIANSAIDGVAGNLETVVEEIAKYAGTDLVCYRAEGPRSLVEAQAAAWDPILAFAREKIGADFICTEGVMFVMQPHSAGAAVAGAVGRIAASGAAAPFTLASLHVMTTLTGSVLIALGVAFGEFAPEDAWRAAHVDEDFEIAAWGDDAEARARRENQWREFAAAAKLWQLTVADAHYGA
jgi:chaperone required for assembly of F1-ATPase